MAADARPRTSARLAIADEIDLVETGSHRQRRSGSLASGGTFQPLGHAIWRRRRLTTASSRFPHRPHPGSMKKVLGDRLPDHKPRPVVSKITASNLPRRFNQSVHDADQVAAHGAADAAIVHLEDFLVSTHDEVIVDPHFTELVHDDGVTLAVILGEDTVQERCLAGAEIPGQDGYGESFRSRSRPAYQTCPAS